MNKSTTSDGDRLPGAAKKGEQPPVSPTPTEPTSARQLPSLSSAQGSDQSLPLHVAIADNGVEITARIKHEEDADNLIQILQTIKPLLRNIYGQPPSVLADPSDPPDIGNDAQRVFRASMTVDKEAETGMSFFITKAQKAELQRLGYSDEQIREMRPEDAHRALGLIT